MTPPIDVNALLTEVHETLAPTRASRVATPDISWVLPLIRDTLFEEVLILHRGNQYQDSDATHRARALLIH